MKCNKCGEPTNGAYFERKPFCNLCYNRKKVRERKVGRFWEEWTNETQRKKS